MKAAPPLAHCWLLIFVLTPLVAEETDPAETARLYFEAHNQRDREKIEQLFADDITVEEGGVVVQRGKKEVLDLEAWNVALGARSEVEEIRPNGPNAVIVVTRNRNEFFELLDIEEVRTVYRVVVADGKITRFISAPVPKVTRQVNEAVANALQWVKETDPERFEKIVAEGNRQSSGQAGALWLALLRDWKDATRDS